MWCTLHRDLGAEEGGYIPYRGGHLGLGRQTLLPCLEVPYASLRATAYEIAIRVVIRRVSSGSTYSSFTFQIVYGITSRFGE